MNKYKAIWVMQDGNTHDELFEAEIYEILPNGVAMFFTFPTKSGIELIPTPPGGPQQQAEIAGTAAGFVAIHKLN